MSKAKGKVFVVNRHVVGKRKTDFYVGRPSVLGNPFKSRDRATNVRLYRSWLRRAYSSKPEVRDVVDGMVELVRSGEDVTLSCWCAPKLCHADVLREFVLSLA